MTIQSTLDHICVARPAAALHPEQHVGAEERAQVLKSILSSTPIDMGRSALVHRSRSVRPGKGVIGVAAGAIALGLVGSGIVVNRMDHGGHHVASRPPTTSGLTKNVADVEAHLTKALTNISDIEGTQSRFTLGTVGVDTESRWASPDGDTVRIQTFLNGQEQYDETMVTADGVTNATVVDFPNRAWWTWSEPSDAQTCPSNMTCPGTSATSSLSPSSIMREVQNGTLRVVANHQAVAGHETIELAGSASQAAPNLGTFDLWIDAGTYLPVRTANTGMHGATSSSDFQWLAVTATNLAQLQVVVPSGFTRSAAPISPAVGPAGGLG